MQPIAPRCNRAPIAGALVWLALTADDVSAQLRTIDLTGRPSAALTSPANTVSHGVELAGGGFLFVDGLEKALLLADLGRDDLRTLGRIGAGPGEYRSPSRAIADGKGGALVPDLSLDRVLMITPDGRIGGTGFSRLENGGMAPSRIRGVDPDGRLIGFTSAPGGGRDSLPIQRWDPTTKRATRLTWWPIVRVGVGPEVKASDGRAGRELRTPGLWSLRTAWVALADGSVAIVRPEPYRVDVVRPDGTTVRGPEVEYEPVRITAAFREEFRRTEAPMPDDQFPDALPPFEGFDDVIAAPNGEVWVGRMQDWSGSYAVYDVFNARGVRVAQARLRPHSKVVGFGRGSVYVARQTQDDDLWYLERYRLP
jgi:hypothetical protein